MSLHFVGIGDLHLDGKLRKYLPDLNQRIVSEVEKCFDYARRNGIKLVVFYGDICDVPHMSADAARSLVHLMTAHKDLQQVYITGNHDIESNEVHSMQLFIDLCATGVLPNVRVIDKPVTLFRKSGTPLRLLPWPSLDTEKEALNVIHEGVAGAVWDGGRPVESGKVIKHWTVGGHLHSNQVIGKVHFSGTLYQTSFGERPRKYFHDVRWDQPEDKPVIQSIKCNPGFKLINLKIETIDDLSKIEDNPNFLYKVFVQTDVVLDSNTFDGKTNVVKVNSYKTKTELEELIHEELRMDDEFDIEAAMSVETNLKQWLLKAKADDTLKRAAFKKYRQITTSNV
jgi:DNA repair exonuclease SbcCD nuclease subunit